MRRSRLLLLALAALACASPSAAQAGFKKSDRSDMEAFLDEVQTSYPFFDLKGIRRDWKQTAKRLQKQVRKCQTDAGFMALVGEGIACLRGAHMYVTECAVERPEAEPQYSRASASCRRPRAGWS